MPRQFTEPRLIRAEIRGDWTGQSIVRTAIADSSRSSRTDHDDCSAKCRRDSGKLGLMKKSDPVSGNDPASKLVAAAESLAERRDWGGADELFHQAIVMDPSPASRIAYGVSLANQERFFEAVSAFAPVLQGTDRDAIGVVCHNLAAIYRDIGESELARHFQWKATLAQADSGAEELLGMANDAFACERHEAAESLVMSAVEIQLVDEDDNPDADLIAMSGLIEAATESPAEGVISVYIAYQRHQAESNFRKMGFDQLNLSILFGRVKRFRAQEACLKRAIRCFEQAPAPYSLQRARQLLDRFDRMRVVRSFNGRRN